MKKSIKIAGMIAVLVFTAISVTNGQYGRFNRRMSYPGQCMDIPGLTDVQAKKITAINDAHKETIDNMRADFYAAEDIITANNIKAKMTLEQNNHLKKISEVLDEEQLKYFNENIIAGPAGGRARAVNRAGRVGGGYGYTNAVGYGRGPCGMGYGRGFGRGYGRGMGYGNFKGGW